MKKVCTKNLVFQIDQGNLISRPAWLKVTTCLKTSELSNFTIDQGNLMSIAAQKHTWWKNNLLLKYIVKLCYSTRTTSSTVESTRRTSTSTFQDYHILSWSNCMASAFENWVHKSRTIPNRHALQRDLQQSQSFNPFNQELKPMIHEVVNMELCESLDTEPKAQCKICLSYWDVGIVYCTWVSTTGSYETRSSARTCLTPVALKKCVARWTNWRTKTTRTT